jgi:hypothetical protein
MLRECSVKGYKVPIMLQSFLYEWLTESSVAFCLTGALVTFGKLWFAKQRLRWLSVTAFVKSANSG